MGRAVPALNRGLDILELFLESQALSATDVGARLQLPRTTVHELLTTLVARRYLVAVPGQPTRYRLAVRVFQLGTAFADQLDLAREAQRAASEVAEQTDETVHVAVLDDRDVIYIARHDSTRSVRMVSAVGGRLPAHCTGVGKMLLSDLSREEFAERYPRGVPLATMTRRSIPSPAKLAAVLKQVRADGLAYDDGESSEDVHCVAAGIRDHTGAMVAAMSISVPATRWDDSKRSDLAEVVRSAASRLSQDLGFQPLAGAGSAR